MDASDTRTRTKEEAADWLLKLQAGEISRAEREAFIDWLRESPLHVAEMLRMTNVHDGLGSFQRWNEVDTHDHDGNINAVSFGNFTARDPEVEPPSHPRAPWRMVSSIAACAVAVAVGSFWLVMMFGGQTIRTDRGERREVTLSDGSVLQIDPETKLRVKFDEGMRRIDLERGRAVFRVVRNPARPFSVKAEDTIVRAVGTAFGVEHRKGGVRVTVAEGKVAILGAGFASPELRSPSPVMTPAQGTAIARSSNDRMALAIRKHEGASKELVLSADEQITVRSADSTQRVRKVDSSRELAWAQGRLVFEKETVASVVEDFNRYNQTQLRVESPALAAQLVSGVFDASDPESFIAFLQSMVSVKVIRDEDDTVALTSAE